MSKTFLFFLSLLIIVIFLLNITYNYKGIMESFFWPLNLLQNNQEPLGKAKIIIKLEERTLYLYFGNQYYKSYPITIGKKGEESPVGEWEIINKGKKPPDGPLGSRWLGLNCPWGVYGIHGTNKPGEIGLARSLGCIRLHNEYVEELYDLVDIGTPVQIIGQWKEITIRRPLKKGDKGKDVMQLQRNLRQAGYNPGPLNGHFQEATEKAVQEVESQFGLYPDGVTDDNVLQLLNLN